MDINRRELSIYILNIAVFVGVALLVWVFLVRGFWQLYLSALIYYTGGESGRFPSFVLALMYYAAAVGLAFDLALAMRLLRPAQSVLEAIRRYTYPPYRSAIPKEWPPLVTRTQFRNGEMYSLKLALVMLLGSLFYLVVIVRVGYIQAPQYGESVLRSLGEGQISYLITFVSYLLSVPFGQIEDQFLAGMDNYAIVGNLLFLWIPAVFLTIGVLNLISFLHNRVRRLLYGLVSSSW